MVQWHQVELALAQCSYNQALDKLEGLVMQCLFEMEKLNLCGTVCQGGIKHLNIEVWRLWMFLHFKLHAILARIKQAEAHGQLLLASEMSLWLGQLLQTHRHICQHLLMLSNLDGFTSDQSIGIRMGTYEWQDMFYPPAQEDASLPKVKEEEDAWEDMQEGNLEDQGEIDDDLLDEFDHLNSAFSHLSIHSR
ncbi:hypothetical protein DACRYDRAFT_15152 [Dacryopinax primogenitus]|uniref:Uncharacterized protein n=1 Tax=Dacryopinax primogenitus (strain DJM 731) TaxID=1858805 RepID=M5G3P8_DACPD|nr:uncharacterized protein DACRYDRAFT_15152 [Dacryopinax primogenitus]EJU03299.1 hypothetical protein DACRYDRAFT_15152 [Dacryopinax primogenitus]